MTLEDLNLHLDGDTIIRVVDTKTAFFGSVKEFKDIKLGKRFVKSILHYPTELLIILSNTEKR